MFEKLKSSVAARACPVCASREIAEVKFSQQIDWQKLDDFAFSSRKTPEMMSWHMVRCAGCDVVYAAEVPSGGSLIDAYHEADYDSVDEANYAARSYAREISPAVARLKSRGAAMEIGAGNGAFLTELKKMGFEEIVGFEPSKAAIAAASPAARPMLREGIMEAGKLPAASFDLIGCFQTLEHVRDPLQIARDVHSLLRPGGMVVFIAHNYRGLLNRMLGRRSPIVDIEHLQLFSPASVHRLLEEAGFSDIEVRSFWNQYPLRYWLRLLPVGAGVKNGLAGFLEKIGLGGLAVSANVGNMLSIGYRRQS
jgi:SAM-dependent methyltransferase